MSIKNLKIKAGQSVMESDYSDSAKKQLLNFIINEASESQLKTLIMDGQIEILDEDSIDIINQRFDNMKENDYQDFINIVKEDICETLNEQNHSPDMLDEMINFVENEASNYQLLSMFFEGILPDEESNPEKESILNEAVQNIIEGKELIDEEIGTFGKAAIATLVGGPLGLITYGAYKVYQRYMTKAGRMCRKAVDRRACRKQYKITALKMQINALKSGMSKCSKAKNPEKCREKVQKKIEMLSTGLAGTAKSTKQRKVED